MRTLRTVGSKALLPVVLVVLASILFGSGCVVPAPTNTSATDLTTHGWKLTSYQDNGIPTSVLHGTTITLRFEDFRASGSSGCNIYFASYAIQESSLLFDPIGQTDMHCEEPGVMAQESAYLDLLASVEKYRIEGNRLALLSADGTTLLLLEKALPPEPRPLTGTVWILESYASGDAVVLPRAGTEITAVFSADGRVSGSGGCNQYSAEYARNGSALHVGAVSATKKACSTPIIAQETAYFTLLASAEEHAVDGDWLSIQNASKKTVLSFSSASEGA